MQTIWHHQSILTMMKRRRPLFSCDTGNASYWSLRPQAAAVIKSRQMWGKIKHSFTCKCSFTCVSFESFILLAVIIQHVNPKYMHVNIFHRRLTVRPFSAVQTWKWVVFFSSTADALESGVFEPVLEWSRRAFLNHWGMYNSSLILL